ncbi:MAG: cytochrome c-type biogenesis CcmF C-terminal domain-containing protein [Myxococcota bacterium]
MAALGTLALLVALVVTTYAGCAAVVGARRRLPHLVRSARYALHATLGAVALASAALIHAFVSQDHSIKYVQQYSDRTMETFYRVTAFWGGMDGSLLFWLLVLSLYASIAVHLNRDRHRELVPYVIASLAAIQLFFLVLLCFEANPFATYLSDVPTDGKGLNPLLQNLYMVFHPPALYLGFVGMAVPFAFGFAALVTGLVDEAWIRSVRRWMLIAWFFLTLGNVLGALWAYEELGWGGYWGWDPVENAAFVPWLTATAFLHSIMIQERRRTLRVWNSVLVILTFLLTIFGTFLTRSGFVQSVHTFAQSGIGWYFAIFLGIAAVVSFGFLFLRLPLLRGHDQLESLVSREFAFVVNNWLFLLAAFTVLVLTLFPTLSEAVVGEKITIGPTYFNKWMIPIGLALLFLTGVGPLIAWRRASIENLLRQFAFPVSLGLAVGVAAGFAWARDLAAGICFGLCAFVFGTVGQELWRGTRVRQQTTGLDGFTALVGLVARDRRRYGGYVVHLGMALMFAGWAGNARKVEADVQVKPGETFHVKDYTLRLDELKVTEDAKKEMVTAHLTIMRGGRTIDTMRPARWYFRKLPDQPTSEVAIRRTWKEDLYITLGGFELDKKLANVRATVNPLVDWFWAGFAFLAFGTALALAPEGLLARAGVRVRGAVETATIFALLLLPVVARAQMVDPSGSFGRAAHTALEREVQSKLICMCGCSRQVLADCRCGFAGKEREAIGAKVDAGWSKQRILDWYTKERGPELGKPVFGAAALAAPPDTWFNRLSWIVPYAGGGLGGLVALGFIGRRLTRRRRSATGPGSPEDPSATAPAPDGEYADRLADELSALD